MHRIQTLCAVICTILFHKSNYCSMVSVRGIADADAALTDWTVMLSYAAPRSMKEFELAVVCFGFITVW